MSCWRLLFLITKVVSYERFNSNIQTINWIFILHFKPLSPSQYRNAKIMWHLGVLRLEQIGKKNCQKYKEKWQSPIKIIAKFSYQPGTGSQALITSKLKYQIKFHFELKALVEKGRKWRFLTDLCFSWFKMDPACPSYHCWLTFSPRTLFRRRTLGLAARKVAKPPFFQIGT